MGCLASAGVTRAEDIHMRSRGALRPSFPSEPPSSHGEGAGKAGRRLAPMVRVQQKSTRQNHRFSRNRPAFPAQWFYGLYAISPVTGLSCHRHPQEAEASLRT